MALIGIADYGVGNLMSVSNALRYIGLDSEIISDPYKLNRADGIILPGVGAFPAAAKCLEESGFVPVLKEQAEQKPLLGICVGMQLLFTVGYEFEKCPGLDLIPGEIRKLATVRKLPHIGWNRLSIRRDTPLLEGLDSDTYVYFVHSFGAVMERETDLIAETDYGAAVTAAVGRGNVYGCQFHPEKSGDAGLQILRNFGRMI